MNFDQSNWRFLGRKLTDDTHKKKGLFSNLNHPWIEVTCAGPYGVKLRNMAEANQASLKLYRQACRFVPTLLNRHATLNTNDYHMSKRILGMWFRRGKNMKDLSQISELHKTTTDYLIDSVYGNVDSKIYNAYLHEVPQTRHGELNSNKKLKGLDNEYFKKFAKKTRFFEKFIKGSRSLMK